MKEHLDNYFLRAFIHILFIPFLWILFLNFLLQIVFPSFTVYHNLALILGTKMIVDKVHAIILGYKLSHWMKETGINAVVINDKGELEKTLETLKEDGKEDPDLSNKEVKDTKDVIDDK